MRMFALIIAGLLVCGCRETRSSAPNSARVDHEWSEVFPGVRTDAVAGAVEVDGRVATDVHDPQTPDVFLEVIVCTRDTREYESLVVVDSTAAQVHAALLLIGLEPGRPGGWKRESDGLTAIEPEGEPVRVRLVYESEGLRRGVACEDWIVVRQADGSASDLAPLDFVFAGSGFRTVAGVERYLGDVEGTVVGLTTFGTEVIAPVSMHNPDSTIEEPTFMARGEVVPKVGQPVKIRIERIRDRSAP